MVYYGFNRCPEEAVPELEKIAKEYGMGRVGKGRGSRGWEGYLFVEKRNSLTRLWYSRLNSVAPLALEICNEMDHHRNNQRILEMIKQIIAVCKPNIIYGATTEQTYNMSEFE